MRSSLIALAIVLGSALIAASILVTHHWEIVLASDEPVLVGRLNRWTGSLELCVGDLSSVKELAGRGVRMICPKD